MRPPQSPPIGAVVHADDLGLCSSVNRGILRAHAEGVVTATALMANMPAAAEGAAVARERPGLAVGLHFNLTEGEPLTEARTLRGRDGRFRRLGGQLVALVCGFASSTEVAAEFEAQRRRAESFGIVLTHVNGHEHVHLFGAARVVALDFARRTGVWVRRPNERLLGQLGGSPAYFARRCVLRTGATAGDWRGVAHPDRFVELTGPRRGRSADWLVETLATSCGVVELLCHPGEPSDDPLDPLAARRVEELAILTAPRLRERLAERGVRLEDFAAVRSTAALAEPCA